MKYLSKGVWNVCWFIFMKNEEDQINEDPLATTARK